jgi:hypothetical protein
MPLENIQFALIWPVFPMCHQTGLDGVFNDIEPFLVITLTAAKLPVKKNLFAKWVCRQRAASGALPQHARIPSNV